ncbi:hypothetical protein EV426DRAFT_437423 [Tirmania nivea]|nr:hypothetical protein EV426DRAFT_437423 [Tirmania nivea]
MEYNCSSTMPLTLQPDFSPSPFLQKSGSEYFWGSTKAPGVCKSLGLSPQIYPSTRLQSFQLREHDGVPLRRKEEVHLPPELWDMILDEVNCTSTVTRLCRVSRDLYHSATPKVYSKIGILYKSSSDVKLVNFNEASIKDTTSLEKNSTPFSGAHWHHLRYVRSLVIVDATQDSIQECTVATCWQRCSCPHSNLQQINVVFGKMGQIFRKMAFPKSIKWFRHCSWVALPENVLKIIAQRFGDSLSRLHLSMSVMDGRKVGKKIEAAIGRMTCLKELELTGVTQIEVLEVIGKYLQSPAGKSVRELRLEGLYVWTQIQGLQKLLGFDAGNPGTTTKLEIESLHLRHFHLDEADKKRTLSMMLNPKTLTSITLIDCGSLAQQLKAFPNLKRLYLGGAYQHIPMVFDELPVLEELIISVDAKIEQQFYGGITRYFKQKGHGLRRLGVLFTEREGNSVLDRGSVSSYKRSEQAFMEKIRYDCKNLEELGIWHTDIFFAESIILHLPKLRAVSLNNNNSSDEEGPHITYPPPYPTGLSGIHYLFQQSDIEIASTRGKLRSQLTFIKQNDEAWRRLGPRVASMPGDHVMPTMTIRKLSRSDADIPRMFLVEGPHIQDFKL